MRPGEAWNDEIKPVLAQNGWNIEYEPPSAKLLSIAPDAASKMDGYGWRGQWLFDEDDNDAFYNFMTRLCITAAEDKSIDFQTTTTNLTKSKSNVEKCSERAMGWKLHMVTYFQCNSR